MGKWGRWCARAGGVEGPARRSRQEEPLLLTPFSWHPHRQPLTHQQRPGSGLTPSGRPLGASAAPHSPQSPPHWTPPQLRAAAGPAKGPSPWHLPQPAGRVGSSQGAPSPGLPAPSQPPIPVLQSVHWEDQGPSLPKLHVCARACACVCACTRVCGCAGAGISPSHHWGWSTQHPGHRRIRLGSALRPISQTGD